MTNHSIITYATMRKLAMDAAKYWKDYVFPLPFDHTFPLSGMRVRIHIERAESADDTKPLRRVDEDSQIED